MEQLGLESYATLVVFLELLKYASYFKILPSYCCITISLQALNQFTQVTQISIYSTRSGTE